MTKISLVQLSQMENKPKQIYRFYKSGKKELYLFDGNNYRNEDEGELLFFNLCDFNELLIEIEEEPLLTDEDKECLRNLIKYSNIIDAETILMYKNNNSTRIMLKSEIDGTSYVQVKLKYLKNLEPNKHYKISDLGLYDEE